MINDTAELEVPQQEVKVEVPNPVENKPSILFERARKRVTESKQSIFKAFSQFRAEHPTIDLTSEQQQMDALNVEMGTLDTETEKALLPLDEVLENDVETSAAVTDSVEALEPKDEEVTPAEIEEVPQEPVEIITHEEIVEQPVISEFHPVDPEVEYQKALEIVKAKVPYDLQKVLDSLPPTPPPETPGEREFNAKDKARHKLLAFEARRQGVQDIEGFNRLVNYFETQLKDSESYHAKYKENITDDEREKIIKAVKAKGYKTAYFNLEPKDGKIGLSAYKDINFNINRDNIPVIKALIETGTDPIPFMNLLKQNADLGSHFLDSYNLEANNTYSKTAEVLKLLRAPGLENIFPLMEGMARVPHGKWELNKGYESEKVIELNILQTMVEAGNIVQYPPEFFDKARTLANTFGRGVNLSELPVYDELLNNPEKINFLSTLVEADLMPTLRYGYTFDILDSITSLEKDGLIEPLIKLISAGIKIDGRLFAGYGYKTYGEPNVTQEEVDKDLLKWIAEPQMQVILNEPERQDFARILKEMDGNNAVWASKNSELFDLRKDLVALNNLIFPSLDSEYKGKYSMDDKLSQLKTLLESDERRQILLSPEFTKYLQELRDKKNINLEPRDFFDFESDIYDFSEHSQLNRRGESLMVLLFKSREIADLIDPNMTGRILEGSRKVDAYDPNYSIYDDFSKLRDFAPYINTVKLLRENGIPLDPEKFSDAKWIATVQQMPLLAYGFIDKVPREKMGEWLSSILQLPYNMQEGLKNSFFEKDKNAYIVDEVRLEKVRKLAEIVSGSEFFPKDHFTNDWQLQSIYKLIGKYEGDPNDLFTDGMPNMQLTRLLLDNQQGFAIERVLSEQVLATFPESEQRALKILIALPDDLKLQFLNEAPNFPQLTIEQDEKYRVVVEVISQIRNSPSAEIKRLEKELIGQLWKVDDPRQALDEIIGVFEKNNLPLVGKTYRVFETIYDNPNATGSTILEQNLSTNPKLSPVLRAATARERREIIYKDLVNINVESGNPQLRDYLDVIRSGEEVVAKLESGEELSESDNNLLSHFFDKMDMLYVSSLFGRTIEARKRAKRIDSTPSTSGLDPNGRLDALRKNFHVREDQGLTERLSEMFLKPTGFNTIEEVMAEMDKSKIEADRRNREWVRNSVIELKPGDRFKGINSGDIGKIIERGVVAREYLGAGAASDATPYDTDTGLVLEADLTNGVESAVQASPSRGYGDIFLVIRDRGQFGEGGKYESFASNVDGARHYGIRTGIASTEIDAIVAFKPEDKDFDNLNITTAQNGVYIPVADTSGNIIFTPEQFDEFRKTFDGVSEYSSASVEVKRVGIDEGNYSFPEATSVVAKTRETLDQLSTDIQADRTRVQDLSDQVKAKLRESLATVGVNLRGEFDTSIYGAELVDTGSTSRGSNLPGDYDFDLSLQLDPNDAKRLAEITGVIKDTLQLQEDKSHTEADYVQVRAMGSQIIEGETLDIDIGVGKRADEGVFASSDAVSQKLESIRSNSGDEAYYDVLGNIVLAKKILKEGHAYKKFEDGGMGGIGVENWILRNNGNILDAFQSFWDVAHEGETVLSYEDFAKKYKVFDAGINIKFNQHDNFVKILKPAGYQAMLGVIGNYLGYSVPLGSLTN